MVDLAQRPQPRGATARNDWLADEAMITGYRASMLRRAAAIVKNAADAEDAVQEALERAWRSRDRVIPGKQLGPWLLKITTNVSIDLLRRRKLLTREAPQAVVEVASAAEENVLQHEAVRSIGVAIANLAPAHRLAFVLHDVHGYSSREISLQAQLPYHTVRTHLFRARQAMRRALSGVES